MDKSYVGMQVCFWCGKETGVILLDRRLRKSLAQHTMTDYEPCKACVEKFSQGILIIEVSPHPTMEGRQKPFNATNGQEFYPTGSHWVIREEAANRIFKDLDLSKSRKLLINRETATTIGLYATGAEVVEEKP